MKALCTQCQASNAECTLDESGQPICGKCKK